MTGIYKLTGTLQQYVWGGENYIPYLVQFASQPNNQYAEWWLGAHSSSPSQVEINNQTLPLTQFFSQQPETLGQESRAIFGDELPYLLKILDVRLPLSIQLHPTKDQAELGFAEENAKGIALNDPKRTYKDNNHKPEMMIALSDFWLLHGFKPKAEILQTLRQRSQLAKLAESLETQSISEFYAQIMQADQSQLAQWLNPVLQNQQIDNIPMNDPDYWVLYCKEAMEIADDKLDAGLMCFYLFNIVFLKKGEGIYQDAGIPHAYLRGQNIELMSCSDNVIRGGLTPKYVNIPELLKIVDCREVVPEIIAPAPLQNGSFTYNTPAKDFALENINYDESFTLKGKTQSASILFVMEGDLVISEEHSTHSLKQGESVLICADVEYKIEGKSTGYAVIAKLPE